MTDLEDTRLERKVMIVKIMLRHNLSYCNFFKVGCDINLKKITLPQ